MISVAKVWQTPALFPQWLSNLWSRSSKRSTDRPAIAQPAALTPRSSLTLELLSIPGQAATAHLQLAGAVDRFTYAALLNKAVALHRQGYRALLLDLRQTTCLELSGLFALISIARIYHGQSQLDPEGGWAALRRAAEEITPALGQRVKLLGTPAVIQTIRNASFCDVFAIYEDVTSATSAFVD